MSCVCSHYVCEKSLKGFSLLGELGFVSLPNHYAALRVDTMSTCLCGCDRYGMDNCM